MRRMLDPTKVGGIPSTIEFDKDGNRKVNKNLGVDGKLTLKSLVSNTNPDGDITKELGGGGGTSTLYQHFVIMKAPKSDIEFNYYTTTDTRLKTFADLVQLLKRNNIQCSGYIANSSSDKWIIRYLALDSESAKIIKAYSTKMPDMTSDGLLFGENSGYTITDTSVPVN